MSDSIEDLAREIREVKALLIELLGKKKKRAKQASAKPDDSRHEARVREFVSLWNTEGRGRLPTASMPKPGTARYAAIADALESETDMSAWAAAIVELARSEFHTGGNSRGWCATIDFLVSPSQREKWIEQARFKSGRQADRPVARAVYCEECGAPATVGPGTRSPDLCYNARCAGCFAAQ